MIKNNEEIFDKYMETGDEKYVYMLRENNKGLVYNKYKKFSSLLDIDDFDYIYDLSLIKTIKAFKKENGKFSTLLGFVSNRFFVTEFNKKKDENSFFGNVLYMDTRFTGSDHNNMTFMEASLDSGLLSQPIYFKGEEYTKTLQKELIETIDTAKTKKINKENYYIIFKYFLQGLSQSEIARKMGLSKERVSQMVKKIKNNKEVIKLVKEKYFYDFRRK